VRIGEGGGGEDFLNPGLAQNPVIDGFEPVEFLVLGGYQFRPVEAGIDRLPAVAAGILEVVGEVAGVDQELLRHAAAHDAGAAEAQVLDDGDPGPRGRRPPRCAHATGAGADGDQVVVVSGHDRRSILDLPAAGRVIGGAR